METDNNQTPFSRALLTAVFVGFFATIICIFFNLVYREQTGFIPSAIINVSSLIFGVNLFFFAGGMIYAGLRRWSAKGEIIYIVLFVLLTIFFAWKAEGATRTHDHAVTLQFRSLLLGVILISGISIALVVPYFFHNKKFNEAVL